MTHLVQQSRVAAARRHSLGLRRDGTVVAVGTGASGELDVHEWTGIVSVAAGNVHSAPNTGRSHGVGLGAGGTVRATGWNDDGQCVHQWSAAAHPTVTVAAASAVARSVSGRG